VTSQQGTAVIRDMANAPEQIRIFLKDYIQKGR